MADVTITLTDEDMRRLRSKATVERRTPENMALYLVAKALKPRKPGSRAKKKPAGKGGGRG